VTMLSQSVSVFSILSGRDAGWQPQQREGGDYPVAVIARAYWPHTIVGLALGAASYAVAPALFLWMLPVVIGLALTIPLVLLVNNRGVAAALARIGLLRTPEEQAPPMELKQAVALRGIYRRVAVDERDALERLGSDELLLRAHLDMLPPPRQPGDPIDVPLLVAATKIDEADDYPSAIASLTRQEKLATLADAAILRRALALRSQSSPALPRGMLL